MRFGPLTLAAVLLVAGVLSGCLGPGLEDASGDPRPAPEFQLTTLDGEAVNLSHYEGKVLVVDIMGSWCTPCRAQMPHLKEFAERHPEDAAVLSIAISDTAKDLDAFRREYNASWDFALDTDDAYRKFDAVKVPSLYVVHNGKIVAEDKRALVTADELSHLVETLKEREGAG